jgi:hypothetical protein
VLPAVRPTVVTGSGLQDDDGEEVEDGDLARRLLQDGSSLYTGYSESVEDVMAAHRTGQLRRVEDSQRLALDVPLTRMATELQGYFTHAEAKAANPHGVGLLGRRHIHVKRVEAIGKESNRLALMQAEETYATMGGKDMASSVVPGTTTDRAALASLFAEDIRDLMAATCLARRTLYEIRQGGAMPSPQSWVALQEGMYLLDPDDPQSIVGWRNALATPGALAAALSCQLERARALLRGRERWTPDERATLITSMVEQRT